MGSSAFEISIILPLHRKDINGLVLCRKLRNSPTGILYYKVKHSTYNELQ